MSDIFKSASIIILIPFISGCIATSGDLDLLNRQISRVDYKLGEITDNVEKMQTQVDSIAAKQSRFQQRHNENWSAFDLKISGRANSIRKKHSKFEQLNSKRWEDFARKYDPELRAELDSNLAKVRQDKESVAELQQQAQAGFTAIAGMESKGGVALETIKQNRKEAMTQNVISEFKELTNTWTRTQSGWEDTKTRLAGKVAAGVIKTRW